MKTIKQYYHRRAQMPNVGDDVELVNRQGKVQKIGRVIGKDNKRTATIKIVELDSNGKER